MNRPAKVILSASRADQGQSIEIGYTSTGELVVSTINGIDSKTVAVAIEKAKQMAGVIRTNKLFAIEFDGGVL